jgi:peptidoglycan/xylan/chitin deacetylase (PgdA/CDA1 family)
VTRPLVILMYHALYANERELQDITPEDRPYAVSTQRFAEQLQAMRDAGLPFIDPARLGEPQAQEGGVLLSFDDGHASNCTHALPALARHDARAVFFITSDFVERRPGFCSWTQLREMAEAGMTLGSHGRSHRFLNDLGDTEAVAELRDSRDALQDRLGQAVDQVPSRVAATGPSCCRPGASSATVGSIPLKSAASRLTSSCQAPMAHCRAWRSARTLRPPPAWPWPGQTASGC